MQQAKKARAIGFNHVALEVDNIDEALAFYARLFDFELRGRSKTSAFIDLGDQAGSHRPVEENPESACQRNVDRTATAGLPSAIATVSGSAFAQNVYLAQTGELDGLVVGKVLDLCDRSGLIELVM